MNSFSHTSITNRTTSYFIMNIESTSFANKCNFSEDQRNEILYAIGCPAIISSLCCLFAISLVMILQFYKYFVYRLAVYQVLASQFSSLAMALMLLLINYKPDNIFYKVSCQITGSLMLCTLLTKLIFTVWLTFHLFCYVVFFKNLKRLEWLYISTSILVPILVACIPFITKSYGVSGAWCSMKSWKGDCSTEKDVAGIVEQFVLYYGPATFFLVVVIIAVVIMFAVMVYRAHQSKHSTAEGQPLIDDRNQKVQVLKQLLPLLSYPIIYFLLLLFPLTNRIYMAISKSKDSELLKAHGATQASMGTFAALALVIHICVVKSKKLDKNSKEEDHLSTFAGVTPYSSGAVTKFSIPVESDVT